MKYQLKAKQPMRKPIVGIPTPKLPQHNIVQNVTPTTIQQVSSRRQKPKAKPQAPIDSRSSIREFCVVMMTINRKEVTNGKSKNYIQQTLDTLYKAGVFNYPKLKFNLMESGSKDLSYLDFIKKAPYKDKINIVYSDTRLFLPQNYARSMRHGAANTKDIVMLMEDDITTVHGFMHIADAFIEKNKRNQLIWSFHAAFAEIAWATRRGEQCYNLSGEKFYGNLCIALRPNEAIELAEQVEHYAKTTGRKKGVDLQIGVWLKKKHPRLTRVCCSVPCRVQHIGDQSSIGNNKRRINQSFDLNQNKI
jgi:hypothetical protein